MDEKEAVPEAAPILEVAVPEVSTSLLPLLRNMLEQKLLMQVFLLRKLQNQVLSCQLLEETILQMMELADLQFWNLLMLEQ